MPVKAITEGRSGNEKRLEQNHCGRCGIVIRGNEFCAGCRKFFQMLTARKEVLINFKLIGNEKLGDVND
jgi:hypothetical protein